MIATQRASGKPDALSSVSRGKEFHKCKREIAKSLLAFGSASFTIGAERSGAAASTEDGRKTNEVFMRAHLCTLCKEGQLLH